MKNFDSLTLDLEDWFDKQLGEIPEPLRQRIEEELHLMPWDRISIEGRRKLALESDYQNDPRWESDRQYMRDLAERLDFLKSKISKWEAIPIRDATDLAAQESNLAKYRQELTLFEAENFVGGVPIVPGRNSVQPSKPQRGRKLEQVPADDPPAKKAAGSRARLDVRKLNTQDMYKRWQKAYRSLQQKKPNMTAVWYAKAIAKSAEGKGLSAETIRKHLKP